ncbi:MAG: hypothetical protein ACTSVI_14225 [Promethearchaeota archaeon]
MKRISLRDRYQTYLAEHHGAKKVSIKEKWQALMNSMNQELKLILLTDVGKMTAIMLAVMTVFFFIPVLTPFFASIANNYFPPLFQALMTGTIDSLSSLLFIIFSLLLLIIGTIFIGLFIIIGVMALVYSVARKIKLKVPRSKTQNISRYIVAFFSALLAAYFTFIIFQDCLVIKFDDIDKLFAAGVPSMEEGVLLIFQFIMYRYTLTITLVIGVILAFIYLSTLAVDLIFHAWRQLRGRAITSPASISSIQKLQKRNLVLKTLLIVSIILGASYVTISVFNKQAVVRVDLNFNDIMELEDGSDSCTVEWVTIGVTKRSDVNYFLHPGFDAEREFFFNVVDNDLKAIIQYYRGFYLAYIDLQLEYEGSSTHCFEWRFTFSSNYDLGFVSKRIVLTKFMVPDEPTTISQFNISFLINSEYDHNFLDFFYVSF